MGLEDLQLTFVVVENHPEYCAWVALPERAMWPARDVLVGFSIKDVDCVKVTPRTLALHEMCHLRMKHLWLNPRLDRLTSHREVKRCMAWYKNK